MHNEIDYLVKQMQSAYDGNPWFGRSMKKILEEIDGEMAMKKPMGQHSILELLYHIINWREFTISRLDGGDVPADIFGKNDWRKLDHSDQTLWKKGLQILDNTQHELVTIIQSLEEEKLTKKVRERKYDVRFLVNGVLQHDIYHLGQIAYVHKLLFK